MRKFAADLRRGLRDAEPVQILLCSLAGYAIGVIMVALRESVALLHAVLFGVGAHAYLSAGQGISPLRVLIVPALGGLVLGLMTLLMRRRRIAEIVDPIEANALHGGRMRLGDSVWLTAATTISNGAGASLGMEAGYSQLGAGLYSWLGQRFRLRRADQRVFVTAGAAAAIAAAFNAPLAGAFYGYELILGGYSPSALAPVVAATVSATLAERSLSHMQALFEVHASLPPTWENYALAASLGIMAAAVAVLAMQAVTWFEQLMRAIPLPAWLRPMMGGLALSSIAWFFPQVLGSGHGAVQFHFDTHWALLPLAALLLAKLAASAVSLGSGFRGGLFSSSLFLGSLYGGVFAAVAIHFMPALAGQYTAFMMAGMAAVAAAVIGAPFTMIFLVLEGTGDFAVTVGVVIAVTVASTLVRILFGYSFATWRFHLRGLGIRGAHDVGWISDLTVERLMRSDAKLVQAGRRLRDLRAAWPPGSVKRLFVVDGAGGYLGAIDAESLYDKEIDEVADLVVAGDLAAGGGVFLLPSDNIRVALRRFDESQLEALPVIASRTNPVVRGYLTEAYALRRYAQELERMRNMETGQDGLFSIGPKPQQRGGRRPGR